MIDQQYIGYQTQPTSVNVDAWRVKLFCQAVGDKNSVYWNLEQAKQQGFTACPVPPTFLKALEGDHCTSADLLKVLGIPVKGVLHAEQSFTYFSQIHVGDVVEIHRKIIDIYEKKSGTYNFVVVESYFKVHQVLTATNTQVILIRNKVIA
jgi:hydroxyacyl-ACP dehydratase HTD2-like protein with hotdog domain